MTLLDAGPSQRVADAADRLRHARLGAELPCREPDHDGVETPGLTGDDWSEDGPREQEAADWCMGCPVVQQCGDYALAAREPYGVWGGMTSADRRRLLRRRGVRL